MGIFVLSMYGYIQLVQSDFWLFDLRLPDYLIWNKWTTTNDKIPLKAGT